MTVELVALAVTYRRPDTLVATLHTLLAQSVVPTSILVVDNDPDASAAAAVEAVDGPIRYVCPGDNLGPAGGLRLGCDLLLAEGYDGWILLVDDDDPAPTPDTVERLVNLIDRHPRPVVLAGVGLVGVRYRRRLGSMRRYEDDELAAMLEVDAIGSGQCPIYRAAALRSSGGFDADLFFGSEDLAIGLSLRRAGWELAIDGDWLRELRAAYQERQAGRALPAGGGAAPWRRYYVSRNEVRIARRHGRWPASLLVSVRPIVGSLRRVPWRQERRRDLLRASVRGVLDGWRGVVGRTVEPGSRPRRVAAWHEAAPDVGNRDQGG